MRQIEKKNHENKAINLILEFTIGKVEKVIKRMVGLISQVPRILGSHNYRLNSMNQLF
jgi:hypothetical protein